MSSTECDQNAGEIPQLFCLLTTLDSDRQKPDEMLVYPHIGALTTRKDNAWLKFKHRSNTDHCCRQTHNQNTDRTNKRSKPHQTEWKPYYRDEFANNPTKTQANACTNKCTNACLYQYHQTQSTM